MIPPFDGIHNCLPPHLAMPGDVPVDLAPYHCTSEEVCQRFSTSTERVKILSGWLALRAQLLGNGIQGIQWLGGSFVEDIEVFESRPPGDVDVVTIAVQPLDVAQVAQIWDHIRAGRGRKEIKRDFDTDHFLISLASRWDNVVDELTYWVGLFSHRRDARWKGMLSVPLFDPAEDAKAAMILNGWTP